MVRLSVLALSVSASVSLTVSAPILAQVPAPEGTTAIAIGEFTGTGDPGSDVLGAGLGEVLLVDAVQMLDTNGAFADCPAIVVEWKRRKDVEAEIELQQGEAFDPASRITPGQLIDPSVMITGVTTIESGQASYVVEMRSHPEGQVIKSISGTAAEAAVLDLGPEIARQLLDTLCPKGWTAKGGTVGGGPGVDITGTVAALDAPFELNGTFQGGTAVFTYSPADAASGSVTYTLAGSGVTGTGTGSYTAAPQPDGTVRLEQTTTGCVDGIPNSCRTVTDVVTLTPASQ